jgi:hypothetical protein
LAGDAGADEIDPFGVGKGPGVDVGVTTDVGPVPLEDAAAVVVDLDLPAALHSSSFKSKVDASYSSEQRPKEEFLAHHFLPSAA